ncbi:MAG: sugar phosphate nucleotidyltransferase [Verrucomicrobiota bacterium]|nr:sugar phosphate nucleotidyltransferase [Verrucomicrobiota bacterium]
MKPTLLVLAAGMGSRYGGLKQIDPVGPSGEIIIDYSIYDAIQAGFGKVVFVIRRDIKEDFKECIGSRYAGDIDIDYAYQELNDIPAGFEVPQDRTKPWGTGHAILIANSVINEPFAAINADDFYGKAAFSLLGKHLTNAKDTSKADFSMVGFILRKTLSDHGYVSRGVCSCNSDGNLTDVVERTNIEKNGNAAFFTDKNGNTEKLTGDEIVSMNMWGFTPSIFDHLEAQFKDFLATQGKEMKSEFFIPTVVDNIIKADKATVKVLESADSWFGVTYKEDKDYVIGSIRELVEKGIYPKKLF